MEQTIHYNKAPIIEAIIDLRVNLSESYTFEQLADVQGILPPEYSAPETISVGEVQFQVQRGKMSDAKTEKRDIGYKFAQNENKYVLQTRLDGFTLSALPPYDRWQSFVTEARKLWYLYRTVVKVENISRAAVRYINRLDIPFFGEPIELKDYLKTYLEVSSEYKYDDETGFFAQVQMPQPDLDGMLVLNQALTSPPDPDLISVIVDIDLFSERSDNPWQIDNESVWEFLEDLHDRKNETFEASITQKTKELIK